MSSINILVLTYSKIFPNYIFYLNYVELIMNLLFCQFDWIDDGAPIRQGQLIEWQRTAGGGADGEVIFGWSDTRDSMRDVYVQKIDA